MKAVAALVIIFLVLHLQCGGACLLSSFSAPEPPCHQHPAHQSQGPCDPGPVLQTTLELPAILPAVIETSLTTDAAIPFFNPEKPAAFLPASIRFSVLRV